MIFVFREEDLINSDEENEGDGNNRNSCKENQGTINNNNNNNASKSNSLDKARFESNCKPNQTVFNQNLNQQQIPLPNFYSQHAINEQYNLREWQDINSFQGRAQNSSNIEDKDEGKSYPETFNILPLLQENSDSQQNLQPVLKKKGFQMSRKINEQQQLGMQQIRNRENNIIQQTMPGQQILQNNKNYEIKQYIAQSAPALSNQSKSIPQASKQGINTSILSNNSSQSKQPYLPKHSQEGYKMYITSNNLISNQQKITSNLNNLSFNNPQYIGSRYQNMDKQSKTQYQSNQNYNNNLNVQKTDYQGSLNGQNNRQYLSRYQNTNPQPFNVRPQTQNTSPQPFNTNPQTFNAGFANNQRNKEQAQRQLMQRIQEKKAQSVKERMKKGFQMTEIYKKKHHLLGFQKHKKQGDNGENNRRNGFYFEKGEKIYQQVLLQYFKHDLAEKAKKVDSFDLVMFQIPNCIKPKPNIQVKKVTEDKMYYGVLQSMRDKHFMDMLDFLEKSKVFKEDQVKKFEEKRMELLNNSFKYNFMLRPKKKKVGISGFSNLGQRQNNAAVGINNTNQSFYNNNSNSFNDFASDTLHGMGWDNTNMSSDQFIINLINGLKTQQQQQNPNQKPSPFDLVPSEQSSQSQLQSSAKNQPSIIPPKQENPQGYILSPNSQLNQRKESQQSLRNSEIKIKPQDEKGCSVANLQSNQQQMQMQDESANVPLQNEPKPNSFTNFIANGIKKISSILKQKIFSFNNSNHYNNYSPSSETSPFDSSLQTAPIQPHKKK